MSQAIPKPNVGLSSQEVVAQKRQFGPNSVSGKRPFRPLIVFLNAFRSPLLIILLIAATLSFFLGQQTSAIIIYVMVFVSGTLDFVNTYKSQKATESLAARVKTTAVVVRNSVEQEVLLRDLVPGDIVKLVAGSIVPADGVVLTDKDFFVDQSALTGESYPVEKDPRDPLPTSLPTKLSVEAADHLFMGTTVITGFATIVVTHTGRHTKFGEIAESLNADAPPTDFERGITAFSYFIMKVAVLMVVFVFLTNTLMGRAPLDSFLFAIAVAVGVTPELLPVILTVSMSHGALLMARKKVIVKNLPSIQNFGSMTVLCTDKTGTLTKDKIALVKYLDPTGHENETVLKYGYLTSIFHTGVSNPLDTAIINYRRLTLTNIKKVDEIPFDYQRKRSSMVVDEEARRTLITKGAPEDVLAVCSHCRKGQRRLRATRSLVSQIHQQYEALSQDGYRVLAVATKTVVSRQPYYDVGDEQGLTFIGLIAFLDPAKPDASVVVQELADLGVSIKILTGDSEVLTDKIARDIQLPDTTTLTGSELVKMSDAQLRQAVRETTIFARVTPDQKERIVRALKTTGAVVGYMGDGINDAPALRVADVGISVDNAVDIAKETADIILLRKSLAVLRDGILEGRKTFHNSLKYILMGLSSNFGNMFSMMAISAFAPFLPMLPVQILLNNFLYDLSQTTIPSDHVDDIDLKKPPRWDVKFIRNYMLTFGPVSSFFDFLTFGLLIWVFHFTEHQFQAGWFIESLTTQVLVIYVIRTRRIPLLQSWPSRWVVISTLGTVGLGWLIPHTPLGTWFHFTGLTPAFLWIIVGIVVAYLLSAEVVKRAFYHFQTKTAT